MTDIPTSYTGYEVISLKLRSVINRMLSMCPTAWLVFKRCLQLCCVLMILSTVLLLDWGGDMLGKYHSYHMAFALYEASEAVFLIGVLVPVCLEDLQDRV